MIKVTGVRFKTAGKVYNFDSGVFVLGKGDHVIVETEQGLGFGSVVIPPFEVEPKENDKPLKRVYRLALEKDFKQLVRKKSSQDRAHRFCQNCIDTLKLKMNLFEVESTFDGSKLTFYFTADGRVDFRELVKMLVREFKIRIEMRQVGIRNQAKMCGGLGRCGREICCCSFIEKFGPVSIRMAKEQSLSLNPTKISGLCGRLMCCLTFENEVYKSLKEDYPKPGKFVETPNGKAKVLRLNVICGRVAVRLETGEETEVPIEKIKPAKFRR